MFLEQLEVHKHRSNRRQTKSSNTRRLSLYNGNDRTSSGRSGPDGGDGTDGRGGAGWDRGGDSSSGTGRNEGMDEGDDDGEDVGGSQGPNGMVASCSLCNIDDNDPRVQFTGTWALESSQPSTVYSTVVEGSTVSLKFNGRFRHYSVRDPDAQL